MKAEIESASLSAKFGDSEKSDSLYFLQMITGVVGVAGICVQVGWPVEGFASRAAPLLVGTF